MSDLYRLYPLAKDYATIKNPNLMFRYIDACVIGAKEFEHKSRKGKRKEIKQEDFTCNIHDSCRSKALALEAKMDDIMRDHSEKIFKSAYGQDVDINTALKYIPEAIMEEYMENMISCETALGKLKAIKEYKEKRKDDLSLIFTYFIIILIAIVSTGCACLIGTYLDNRDIIFGESGEKIYIDQSTGINYIYIKGSWVPRYDSDGELIITEINTEEDN